MAGYVVNNNTLVPMAVSNTAEHTTDLAELADCSLKVMPNLDSYNPANRRAEILASPTLRQAYFKNWLNVYAMSVGEPLAGDICNNTTAITEIVNQSVSAFEAYYAMSAVHQERPDKAAMAVLHLTGYTGQIEPRWNAIFDSMPLKTAINNNPTARKIMFNHPVAVTAMIRSTSAKNFINADGSFDAINTSCCVVFDQGFYMATTLKTCAPLNFSNALTASNLFFGCVGLTESPQMSNMDNVTTLSSVFRNCSYIQTITLPAIPKCTDIAQLAMNCTSLKTLIIGDASGLSYVVDFVTGCPNLESIVLPGLSKTNFSVANTKLSAEGLNNLFTSLGPGTSRTVTITNCPGAGTCDRTIATSKGWTVVG